MAEAAGLTDTVRDLLESGRRERLSQVLEDAHAADIAAALRDLTLPDQVTLFRLLGRGSAGGVLAELDDQPLHELARALDEGEISSILDRMSPADAAQVIEDLPAEQIEKVLDLMKEEKSEEVQEILEHGEKTAGRLMSPDFLAVHEHLTVAQAIEQVRKSPVAETASTLYVVDDHDHLVGSLPWRRLATAILAASVIGLFEDSIRELALLAIFMPIVASMGGIGTTQTATVVVRGLALGDMTVAHLWRVVRKETTLALTIGLANGLVMAGIAYVWKGQALLAGIIAVAMTLNMVVAAVVGVVIPLLLKSFRVDPAIASSVIITTFTDVFGFFSFLGLATLLIRFLH